MLSRLMNLSQAIILATASSLFASGAIAQTSPNITQLESIPDVFERGFFDSGNFFANQSPWGQIEFIFGPEFSENSISREGEIIFSLYRDVFKQQTQNDPFIRTLDLANPFDTSIRANPSYLSELRRRETSEFFFERPPIVAPQSVPQSPQQRTPVRSLF